MEECGPVFGIEAQHPLQRFERLRRPTIVQQDATQRRQRVEFVWIGGENVHQAVHRRGGRLAMGARVDFTYTRGYPATVNDPAMTALVREEAAKVVGPDGVRESSLMMGAEDLYYFLEAVPGA